MDYSQLPEDIIVKISTDHLQTFSQLLAFSHVCKSWRSAAAALAKSGRRSNRHQQRPSLPGLLVAEYGSDFHQFVPLTMFNSFITTPAIHRFNFPPPGSPQLPRLMIPLGPAGTIPAADDPDGEIRKSNPCLASKDGWVLLVQTGPVQLYLLNPITRATVALPLLRPSLLDSVDNSFHIDPANYIITAVISSSPDDEPDDCHVFIILRRRHRGRRSAPLLAWSKVEKEEQPGSWKSTDLPEHLHVQDANYFDGKLYILGHDSVVYVTPMTTPATTTALRTFSFSPAMLSSSSTFLCLSHLNGHLLVVIVTFWVHVDVHVFKLFKLAEERTQKLYQGSVIDESGGDSDDGGGDGRWEEVRSLEGHAVFLGYSHPSVCLPAAPAGDGVEEDRIYFAFCLDYGYYDWDRNVCGVFNLADRKLERVVGRGGCNQNYFWFLPFPWNVGKETMSRAMSLYDWERLLIQAGNYREKDDPSSYAAAAAMRAERKHHQRQQQRQQRTSSICSNRFEALSVEDDEAGD